MQGDKAEINAPEGTEDALGAGARGDDAALAGAPASVPPIVAEEQALLRVVLNKIDHLPRKTRVQVDDAGSLIELRDALAEATKVEDQGSLLEQMHRIEALSRQRGKGESAPLDRKSPYFGHMRLEENGKRRDVLIGPRSYVEPGGGVQVVDWRNAPVSRLFYRYEEGDAYEERLGDRLVEGEILARRTVAIVDAELRRVAAPQGTFTRERTGGWRQVNTQQARLSIARDGSGAELLSANGGASGAAAGHTRGRLGLDANGSHRADRHLPAIAALIDPRQFELITKPTSGLIVVQGSAGSGKTTIGLHRIAYLSFTEPRRFRADKMLVVVYQKALATYVSRVLPSLDVPGVPVKTFADWAEEVRLATFPTLQAPLTEDTPPVVIRAKSHGAVLKMLADRQAALAAWARQSLSDAIGQLPGGHAALAIWDAAPPGTPVDQRVTALSRWVRDATLEPFLRSTLESIGPRLRARTRDVVGEWSAFWTDRVGLGEAFGKHAPGLFSQGQLDEIHRWCTTRERMRLSGKDALPEGEVYGLDAEDDALLLRLYQMQRGPLEGPKGPLAYEHLMVDEVQDFSPAELAVLLEATTRQRSITLAGDTAQAIAPEHGFSDWSTMLDALGVPHERVEPLRVSYRSTREIVEAAEHVLGPLIGDMRPVVPRTGTPVEAFGFASAGEASEFLSHALKELLRNEPTAAVALIARHPEQARLYYEGLVRAEVPSLRWVARQDFSFTAGIDVTDVRQTKGLEFDVVVLLEAGEASYPMNDDARRLLHVAMTRAAHQLWVTYVGRPSPLLPESLRL